MGVKLHQERQRAPPSRHASRFTFQVPWIFQPVKTISDWWRNGNLFLAADGVVPVHGLNWMGECLVSTKRIVFKEIMQGCLQSPALENTRIQLKKIRLIPSTDFQPELFIAQFGGDAALRGTFEVAFHD